ncbi:hypothetical protein B0H66DRAFT_285004 [Apodospora peruviana]|uniref:Uncharacterized protein n=1 Tax=Apodospora peruviana TaxID=516989 RepID=A0AAE0I236_9PEZI|nr:hypothetical protein B0H66DRAFT_285004 [Apodospora peruviana]
MVSKNTLRRKPHVGPMEVVLEAWCYAEPERVEYYHSAFARFLDSQTTLTPETQHEARWSVTQAPRLPEQRAEKEILKDGMSYVGLEFLLKTLGTQTPESSKPKVNMFDDIYNFVKPLMMKHPLDVHFVWWRLQDRAAPHVSEMRLVTLPPPADPSKLPAQQIEQFLSKLVHTKNGHRNKKQCKVKKQRKDADVLKVIDSLLCSQEHFHDLLSKLVSDLAVKEEKMVKNMDESIQEHVGKVIENCIDAMENIDKSFTKLVALFEQHVGCVSPTASVTVVQWNLFRFLLKMFSSSNKTSPSRTIEIPGLQQIMNDARRDLVCMQRRTPALAAHIRLRDDKTCREFKRICDLAAPGPEKFGLVSKLGIEPEFLDPTEKTHRKVQIRTLKSAMDYYETSYSDTLEAMEGLYKQFGKPQPAVQEEKAEADPGSASAGEKKGLKGFLAKMRPTSSGSSMTTYSDEKKKLLGEEEWSEKFSVHHIRG